MRKTAPFVASLFAMVLTPVLVTAEEFPDWAYPVNPPSVAPAADDGSVQRVPGSAAALTRKQISAIGGMVADWHPDEHPAMPAIVAARREPLIIACGYCHLPNGAGRPENSSLTGLTPAYIKQQVQAFRNGDRTGSDATRLPQTMMAKIAQAVTDAEVDEAAAYFASLKPANFVKVVETEVVPKTTVAGWIRNPVPGGGTEPIGNRIIEVAEDFDRFERRDSRNSYIAYVPVGSVQRGAELIATGGAGKTVQCITCHGPELRGLMDVPRIVGRSPGYVFRQLYDLKHGARKGGTAELMKPVVANLTEEDMVAVAAYLGSREP